MKKNLIFALGLSLVTGFTACSSEIEDGTTDIDSWEMPYEEVVAKYTYTHPCAMFNEADFTRVKTMLDNGSAPQAVKDEFNLLKSSQFTNVTYTPTPTEKIVRGDATGTGTNENYSNAMRDAAAAYQLSLLWKLTGDTKYADASIKIMNAWVKVCKEVTKMTPRTTELIDDMLETMYEAMGVGLAAPQVGILKRIVVIDIGEGPVVMINPRIVESSGEQTGEEGCLSVPGKSGIVTRPNYVKAVALDEDMKEYEIEGEGLMARAICHELEHLDGHLYVEKVEGELHSTEYEEA